MGGSVGLLKNYFMKFKNDAKKSHVIVFIDEIDTVLPKRTENLHVAFAQRVNVFLEWMGGGIHSLHNISLIGSTNCLKNIDEAALRPGRFDRIIEFHPLPAQAIVEAFKVHLKLKQLAEHQIGNIDWSKIEESIKDVELAGAAIPNILDRILIDKAMEHHSNLNSKNTNRIKNNFNDNTLYPAPISADDLLNKISNFLASPHA